MAGNLTTEIEYRPLEPTDATGLQELHVGLSEKTIDNRFFGPKLTLSDEEAQDFASVNHHIDQGAIAAFCGKQIIGVARYYQIESTTEAEVAIVVTDGWKKRRIGTELLRRLAKAAVANGIVHFISERRSSNFQVKGLLRVVCGDPVEGPKYVDGFAIEKWRLPEEAEATRQH